MWLDVTYDEKSPSMNWLVTEFFYSHAFYFSWIVSFTLAMGPVGFPLSSFA